MAIPLQLDSTPRAGLEWGARAIDHSEAEAFADALPLSPLDRRSIVATLYHFPNACQVRGMFFDGLVNVIKSERGAIVAEQMMAHSGVRGRIIPFALLPHRDFYKLYFMAAPVLHPNVPLEVAMLRVAETFYPVFKDSMVGRTLSAMMGSEPRRVLERLVDAYKMSVLDNEHAVRTTGPRAMIWECRVEPSPFYAETFRGILQGTLESHGAHGVRIDTVSRVADGDEHARWVFRITW